MAAFKEITANMAPKQSAPVDKSTSPNISRKRKSGEFDTDKENDDADADASTKAPKSKRAKNTSSNSKQPAKKAATKASTTKSSSSSASSKPPTKKQQLEAELAKYDVSQIHLDGEDKAAVPVYDTCNDIRTKIRAHMQHAPKPIATAAGFVRELWKCMPNGNQVEGLSAPSLNKFIKKTGPNMGARMPVFYASYVYFEKLRVKNNKNKTKKRTEMEDVWGARGMDLDADGNDRMWVRNDEVVSIDKYGKTEISRRG